ncbi:MULTISPECIES: hypothetical protein [Pseudomonadota]|jgi:hypothetical protein|uniref:Uncharacterized protein n=1 Tax=Tepidicella xavieri TaxID=360241 RepID=A0A4R6U3Z1_9BURK|nr:MULTISPECIES: hypothetical protein [Pseudomonadota]PLL22862.1 hypothetical protein CWN22_24485 [Klebsiella pneumoniae]PLP10752.1 hypothetical protein CWN14_12700 [Klebsiella pneumoniae]TDQ37774.1 hypothetical protein DFR43_12419 [Tepidicella xavieri]
MMRRRSFSPELLARLREMSVTSALELLGLYWKRDPDFRPTKDPRTVRLYVSLDGGMVELLATGPKWFDARRGQGGGGAIDLTMYLLRLDFVAAVKRLEAAQAVIFSG